MYFGKIPASSSDTVSTNILYYYTQGFTIGLSFSERGAVYDRLHVPGPKTIKKNTNSTPKKSQTQRAKQYKVTSFLSIDCELSTETCSRFLYSQVWDVLLSLP